MLNRILEIFIKFLAIFSPQRKKTRKYLTRIWLNPIKKYTDTLKWLKDNNLASNYKIIQKEELITIKPSKHIETENKEFFYLAGQTLKLENLFVATLPNSSYIPSWSNYLTSDNVLLNDLSVEFRENEDVDGFKYSVFCNSLPEETYIDENIAILHSAGSTNYFHWVINVLPKLEFFEQSDIKIDRYLTDISLPFQRDLLKMMGIDENKIISSSDVENLRAKNIVATSLYNNPGLISKSSLDYLIKRFNIKHDKKTERIFISRKKAKQGRSIINEDEILELLTPLGFKSYVLEEMDFEEQMKLFSKAEIVISPHGAGLTNIIFCPPETKVMEICNPEYSVNCYYILGSMLNFDYYSILGENSMKNASSFTCCDNITVNINKFKELLKLTGIENIKI